MDVTVPSTAAARARRLATAGGQTTYCDGGALDVQSKAPTVGAPFLLFEPERGKTLGEAAKAVCMHAPVIRFTARAVEAIVRRLW